MASTLSVRLHPIVYFTIIDAYERRSNKPGANDKALGTLLGYYEKNVVQVTNCFAVPFSEEIEDSPSLDDAWNQQMLHYLKNANKLEVPVGWFHTAELTTHCLAYHDYYQRLLTEYNQAAKKEPVPAVLITIDPTATSSTHRLNVKAFVRTKAGIPGSGKEHCAIFNPIKVEMEAFPSEQVALSLATKGLDSKQREVQLEGGIEQLTKTTEDMLAMVDKLRAYVDDVLAGKTEMNDKVGRKLMELVTNAGCQLDQAKFEKLVKNGMRDHMMVSYLAQLTKTQLTLNEKILS